MITKQNLHTHTTYVDGKDNPEAIVKKAIELGFDSIGFSEHSFVEFSSYPHQLKIEDMGKYITEINLLKEKYKDIIEIFLGLEMEMYSHVPTKGFDYIIGSAHYVEIDGSYFVADGSAEETINIINQQFCGDGIKFAEKYFQTISKLPDLQKADIIGHFDILSKNIERLDYLDTSSKKYLNLGFEAIHTLKGKIPFFEVNTGAISRGYRTTPYPHPEFLKEFNNCGFGAVITSDCHNKNFLDCYFEESKLLLKEAGFKSRFVLTKEGFKEIEL